MVVHLVGFAVAERRCGVSCVAERAVKRRGKLGGIRHNRRVDKAVVIKDRADCFNTAIHHVGRCDHIRTCLHLGKCGLCEQFQRLVVVDIMAAQHAAVTMRGVFTHADVADHVQLRAGFLCLAECLLHNAILGIGLAADFILVIRDAEQHDAADTGFCQLDELFFHAVDAVAILSHHGGDFLLDVCAFGDKHRVDEGRFVHARFTYYFAQAHAGTQASGTISEIHFCVLLNRV